MTTESTASGPDLISENPHGPLAGHRVLELGSTVAGPFCGRLLADFGAEVVKVEPPEGDFLRSMGKHQHGRSLYASSILRNKALITVNLRTPEGRGLVADLAADCDVLIENFRPGTMEKWGLDHATLSQRNPGLVMVRISGYGQTGPYRNRPGYGVIGEAMGGLRHLTGDPDRPPSRTSVSMTDYITGLYGAFGAALALLGRHATGRGQVVDAALYECAFSFMEPWIPAYDKLGHVAGRTGSRLPGSAPNNLYPTADDDFIHIAAPGQPVFLRLLEVMGRSDLADDDRFGEATRRAANDGELDDIVAAWTSRHRLADIERWLGDADVPATRIYKMSDIFRDPHFAARETIVRAPDGRGDTVAMSAPVPRLSETPGAVRWAGRETGADTGAVLSGMFGISDERIAELRAAGAITRTDRPGDAPHG